MGRAMFKCMRGRMGGQTAGRQISRLTVSAAPRALSHTVASAYIRRLGECPALLAAAVAGNPRILVRESSCLQRPAGGSSQTDLRDLSVECALLVQSGWEVEIAGRKIV